jgi:hypothetical protein
LPGPYSYQEKTYNKILKGNKQSLTFLLAIRDAGSRSFKSSHLEFELRIK